MIFHANGMKDIYFEGMEGANKMAALMKTLHESPLTSFAGVDVESTADYLSDLRTYKDGHKEEIKGLPASDVVKFFLVDGSTVCVRPSGTEPKVRVMVEAPTEEICRKYVDSVVDVIKEKGYEA